MTDPATLGNNLLDSIDTYNHWQTKQNEDETQLQNDLAATKYMSSEEGLVWAVMRLWNDACNVAGDELACTSAQLEVQSSISDYNSTIEGYSSEGKDISPDDATNLAIDTYNLWNILTGGTSSTANPYGTCPPWIDPSDQKALVDNLNDIADSYCTEYNLTATPQTAITPHQKNFTPYDLFNPQNTYVDPTTGAHGTSPSSATVVISAQTNWANQVKSSTNADGSVNSIGQQDGYFSKLNHAFEEINSLVNTQNQSLTTEQKTWSDTYNSYQGAWKDMQNYFNSTETAMVNNEAVK